VKRTAKHINKFLKNVDAIDVSKKDQLAFLARAMVQATLPHSRQQDKDGKENTVFRRKNGNFTISVVADSNYGLPYGSIPRLILAWITTEAVKRKSPMLTLGYKLADFLRELNLARQGGKNGDIKRLREQMLRLFTAKITYSTLDESNGTESIEQFLLVSKYDVWWNPLFQQNDLLEGATVAITLSNDFYNSLIERPVPINLKALQALRRSPLQMDIYVWLTWRLFNLKKEIQVSWFALKQQFGADYANTQQGKRVFKRKFLEALHVVLVIYEKAKVEENKEGLTLFPSPSHVMRKTKS
jgi:hypothetical protein